MSNFYEWINHRGEPIRYRSVRGRVAYYACRSCRCVSATRKRRCPACGGLRYQTRYEMEAL